MHCNVAFQMEHIHDLFAKSFWTNEFKKHREKMLFSLERSQCAATLPYVQMADDHDAAVADLRACRAEMAALVVRLQQKKAEERVLLRRVQATELTNDRRLPATPTHESHIPCNTPQCRGFVTQHTPHCACCKHRTCHRCHQTMRDGEHSCAEEDVATVQELRRNAKQCPECRVYISKVDGCDQMFCVSCHTAFSWNTGERVHGPIHNPHYFEVRARLGDHIGRPPPANPRGGGDELHTINHIRQMVNGSRLFRLSPEIEKTYADALRLRGDTCEKLRSHSQAYSFATNLRPRVDWMRKRITDAQFLQHLNRADKKARYHGELLSLFQMYTGVVGALYHNMTVQRTVDAYEDVVKLKEYTLAQLQAIKVRYGSNCTQYDKYVT